MGKTIRYSKDMEESKPVKVSTVSFNGQFSMKLLTSLESRLTAKLHKGKR